MNSYVKLKDAGRQLRRVIQSGNQIIIEDLDGEMEIIGTLIEDRKVAMRVTNGASATVTAIAPVKKAAATENVKRGRPGRPAGSRNKPKEVAPQVEVEAKQEPAVEVVEAPAPEVTAPPQEQPQVQKAA